MSWASGTVSVSSVPSCSHLRPRRKQRRRFEAHGVLDLIPYKKAPREKVKLPKRSTKGEYDDQATLQGRTFVPEKY